MEYKIPTVLEIKERLAKEGPLFNVVSLFAGGGGSSCGYRMAGAKVLAINEFIPEARNTYHANWPDTTIFPCDVRDLDANDILRAINMAPGELDVLDGSPPCCGFSSSGKRSKGWGQNRRYSDSAQVGVETLFFEYIRILRELKPKCFIAENVAGLAQGVSRGYLNEFLRAFSASDYICKAKILNAQYLGVPQCRHRLIFVGVRKDLWRSEFENKTHPKPFSYLIPLKDAFRGIINTSEELAQVDISKYVIYQRLIKLKKGKSDSERFNLVKADDNRPSPCITASTGRLGCACACHWDNRAFTLKELKRITSVPDDYILTGTYSQQVERLGRMVPPLMMKAVAANLYTNILKELK
nr:MAG TPA: Cytosine specific methyltransferase [Caudoviricetes sp.]